MILFCCAMYCEAVPLIREYKLRRNGDNILLEEYTDENGEISLIIIGVGSVTAAAKVACELTWLCSKKMNTDIHIVNVGACAGTKELRGKIFLVNKITDANTEKSFYPDMLYKVNIPEISLITCSSPVSVIENKSFYDMEAVGIYTAANCFLSPDRITFLKIVSDNGEERITSQYITSLVEQNISYINEVCSLLSGTMRIQPIYNVDWDMFNEVCDRLHFTVSMKNEFKQIVKYASLNGQDIEKILNQLPETADKKQGKEILDELKKRIV